MVLHCTSPVVQKSILIFNTRFSSAPYIGGLGDWGIGGLGDRWIGGLGDWEIWGLGDWGIRGLGGWGIGGLRYFCKLSGTFAYFQVLLKLVHTFRYFCVFSGMFAYFQLLSAYFQVLLRTFR